MAADYRVTGQNQTSYVTDAGQAVAGMRVTYELTDGMGSGYVNVPLSGFTLDTVRAAIEAQVATMKAIEAL